VLATWPLLADAAGGRCTGFRINIGGKMAADVELLAKIEAGLATIQADIAKLRAISARPPASPETMRTPPTDLISAAEAGKLARRSKPTIARWCAEHPWDAPGGFAICLRGRWWVSKAAFVEFLSQRPTR
jgi:hypothetical protein